MKEKIKNWISQFIKFGMVGVVNTVLGLVIYWILVNLGVHYLIANATEFLITVAISYVLNNLLTFREPGKKPEWSFKTLLKSYTSYLSTGIGLASVLLWFWNDILGVNQNLAPVLNLFVTVPLNFLLNKLWVYRKHEPNECVGEKTE